jgi:hypothetical protein
MQSNGIFGPELGFEAPLSAADDRAAGHLHFGSVFFNNHSVL